MSLFSVLFVLFVALKLTGYIAWSWFWVTSPLWIGALIWIAIVALNIAVGVMERRSKWPQ